MHSEPVSDLQASLVFIYREVDPWLSYRCRLQVGEDVGPGRMAPLNCKASCSDDYSQIAVYTFRIHISIHQRSFEVQLQFDTLIKHHTNKYKRTVDVCNKLTRFIMHHIEAGKISLELNIVTSVLVVTPLPCSRCIGLFVARVFLVSSCRASRG